jgi:transcriptional regulator with XRE-family HTH domain
MAKAAICAPRRMAQPFPTYLRTHRRKWALSQGELAELLGDMTADAISKYETLARPPSTELLIACEFIFEQPAHELFPALSFSIIRTIQRNAEAIRARLADKDDAQSARKRRLLEGIIIRCGQIFGL